MVLDTTLVYHGLMSNQTYYWRDRAHSIVGRGDYSTVWRFTKVTVGVDEATEIPHTYGLQQNYPNPFNPTTTIRCGLPQRSHVTLVVFNALGQKVATLVEGAMEAGYHELHCDASGLNSGGHFYRLQAGDRVAVKRSVLVR